MSAPLWMFYIRGKAELTSSTSNKFLRDTNAATIMRRILQQLLLGICLVLAGADAMTSSRVLAQNPAPTSEATPKSGVVTTTSTSNYFMEYAMVVVMFGAALFAVCRSSRRNV